MIVEAGGRVVILDRNADLGRQLVRELGEASARFAQGDVADPAQSEAAVKLALDSFGALHIDINCAGIGDPQKIVDKDGAPADLDRFVHVIRVNLIGTFNVARLAAAAMSRNQPDGEGERGVIINTASVAAFDGQIGQAAYSASKGGIVALTLPLARQAPRQREVGARRHGPVPPAPGPSSGIRRLGTPDHRKPDAEWRSDPAGWGDQDGPEVARGYRAHKNEPTTPSHHHAPLFHSVFSIGCSPSSSQHA
jgi:NAD(P)-dependent dehydrogenase (short-subunit alcohol dehydrogenase family)